MPNHSHTHGDANWSFQDVENSQIHIYRDERGGEKAPAPTAYRAGGRAARGLFGAGRRTACLTRGQGRTIALVNAEGGMGKTTLAAPYWQLYGQQAQHLAWLFCEEGILYAMRSQLPQVLGLTEALKPSDDDGEQQARFLRDYLIESGR